MSVNRASSWPSAETSIWLDLDDPHAVPGADAEPRRGRGGEKTLTPRIAGILLGQGPAARLQGQRVEALVGGVMPDDPGDLPRVWLTRGAPPDLAQGPHPQGDREVSVPSRGDHQSRVGDLARPGGSWAEADHSRGAGASDRHVAVAVEGGQPFVAATTTEDAGPGQEGGQCRAGNGRGHVPSRRRIRRGRGAVLPADRPTPAMPTTDRNRRPAPGWPVQRRPRRARPLAGSPGGRVARGLDRNDREWERGGQVLGKGTAGGGPARRKQRAAEP